MPFEATTSAAPPNTLQAVGKSAERHASKWMKVAAAAHLGLATSSTVAAGRTSTAPPGASRKSAGNLSPRFAKAGQDVSTMVGVVNEMPYWQQFDEELNTQAAWAARRELRHNPLVLAKLDLWWDCALRSLQSGAARRESLDRAAYIRLSRLMSKAMLDVWDSDDAEKCAAQDWEVDAAGKREIGKERFQDCIFELSDIWTRSIEPSEYAGFLQRLLDDIASSDGSGMYFWKEEADTKFGGYVDVDEEDEAKAKAGKGGKGKAKAGDGTPGGGAEGAAKQGGKKKGGKGGGKQKGGGSQGDLHATPRSSTAGKHGGDGGGRPSPPSRGSSTNKSGKRNVQNGSEQNSSQRDQGKDHGGSLSRQASRGRKDEGPSGHRHDSDAKEHWMPVGAGSDAAYAKGSLGASDGSGGDKDWTLHENWKHSGTGGMDDRGMYMDWSSQVPEKLPPAGPPGAKRTPSVPKLQSGGGGNGAGAASSGSGATTALPPLGTPRKQEKRHMRDSMVASAYGATGQGAKPGAPSYRDAPERKVPKATDKLRTVVFKLRWMRKWMGLAKMAALAQQGEVQIVPMPAAGKDSATVGGGNNQRRSAHTSHGGRASHRASPELKSNPLRGGPRAPPLPKVSSSLRSGQVINNSPQQTKVSVVSFGF